MARTVAAVVVLYNTTCADSSTCQALKQTDLPGQVLIYDNSTRDMGNRTQCETLGWTYLGGSGNVGLSKAYNACIDYLAAQNFDGLVCLFDDDTHLTEDYFHALGRATETENDRIFVPMIFAAGRLISPCMLRSGHRAAIFENPEDVRTYAGCDLSAINACMAIDMDIFRNFRYDENIFLDGVDHHFVCQMRERGEKLHIIDYRCDHAFSGMEKPPKASALVRFGIYAKDYRYILRNDKKAYLYLVGKRALRLTAQYRTFAFIKNFFQA